VNDLSLYPGSLRLFPSKEGGVFSGDWFKLTSELTSKLILSSIPNVDGNVN
jgi:hypothetical protein